VRVPHSTTSSITLDATQLSGPTNEPRAPTPNDSSPGDPNESAGENTARHSPNLATERGFHWLMHRRFADAKRFAWLALVAMILSRGLLPALPGTAAGLGTWISGVEAGAALMSQWTAILGCALAMLVLFSLLTQPRMGYGYRLLCMVAAGFLLAFITLIIPRSNVGPAWGVGAGLCAAVLSFSGAWVSLLHSKTRALGLLLTLATSSSLVTTMARILALRAAATEDIASFESARLIATVAIATDVALLAWVVVWLTSGRLYRGLAWGGALIAGGVGASWLALTGTDASGSVLHLLLGRMFDAFRTTPEPYVNSLSQTVVEVCGLALVVAVLLSRRVPTTLAGAAALALIAGGDGDVPMSALLLGLAGLLAGLSSAVVRQPIAGDEHP